MTESVKKAYPSLDEVLDDLCTRFLVNLPDEEFKSFERLFFAVESAHWFYDDFYRERDSRLPRLQLKAFAQKLFDHTPLLQPYSEDVDLLFVQFREYKQEVPTCGAAMLNPTLDKVLLVRGWGSGAKWGFPKGKMGKDETELQSCVREVREETGFDITPFTDKSTYYVDSMLCGRFNRIYLVPNVPDDTVFITQTRKEISNIDWIPVADLPVFKRTKDRGKQENIDEGPEQKLGQQNTAKKGPSMPKLQAAQQTPQQSFDKQGIQKLQGPEKRYGWQKYQGTQQKSSQRKGSDVQPQIPHNKFIHVAPYTTRIRDWIQRELRRRANEQRRGNASAAGLAARGTESKEEQSEQASKVVKTTSSGESGCVPRGSPARPRRNKKDKRRQDHRDVETFGLASKGGGALTQAEKDDMFKNYVRDADRRTRELHLTDDNWALPPSHVGDAAGPATPCLFTFDRDAIVAKMLAAMDV